MHNTPKTASSSMASFCAVYSQAATVENLNAARVGVGQLVEVKVGVKRFNEHSAIAAYDVDIIFDASILRFDCVSFGDQLSINSHSLQDFTLHTTGSINVNEVSFSSVQDLNELQKGNFYLFSLWFAGANQGLSTFQLRVNAVVDGDGNRLDLASVHSTVQVVLESRKEWIPLIADRLI